MAASGSVANVEQPTVVSRVGLAIPFAAGMCGSAVLLFLVQPMFAKMVLPFLGGTPAVWNTCVLFFQTALLCGYAYAHLLTRYLSLRAQAIVHGFVLLTPAIALPIALDGGTPPGAGTPVWWLLGVLVVSAGLPFFVVATTAPLLQRWFSMLPHPAARDPYFLYAASNAGSMVGLLAYPFVLERTWRLVDQSRGWAIGYAVVALLIGLCAIAVAVYGSPDDGAGSVGSRRHAAVEPFATRVRAPAWWLVLAFIPSSLMLGVTTHISTDIAAVPLLWVVPLALYLLTFIVAFAGRPLTSTQWLARVLPFLVVLVMAALAFGLRTWIVILVHLTTFFVAALVCHTTLAERRPRVSELTSFYMWISVGGALGGVFNTLVAPFIFVTIAEYPLVLALLAFLRPSPAWRRGASEAAAIVVGLPLIVGTVLVITWVAGGLGAVGIHGVLVPFLLAAGVTLAFANRIAPFGVAVLLTALLSTLVLDGTQDRVVFAARSFFGVHHVLEDIPPRLHRLRHGSTLHGRQNLDARDRCEPTTYFHPTGPIGQLFTALDDRVHDVAVVGLGSGALACYARPGARWTFYEIDAIVEQVARDPSLFTFLRNSATESQVVLGDGRLTLAAVPPSSLDVVVADAFSSDAVPMHLLTQEFLAMALERLRPDGVLVLNVSNRYLDLEPVLTANAHQLGLRALIQLDRDLPEAAVRAGKTASNWMVLARPTAASLSLVASERWREAKAGDALGWTDDFSNLFDAVSWTQPALR